MGFIFRLQKILNLRHKERETAAEKHAKVKRRLQAAQGKLSELSQNLDKTLVDLDQAKHNDSLSVDMLHYHSLHCAGLEQDIGTTKDEIAQANREAQRTSEVLMEAHRAIEVLEKLRERELDAFNKEESRREKVQMDEVAVTRHRFKEE